MIACKFCYKMLTKMDEIFFKFHFSPKMAKNAFFNQKQAKNEKKSKKIKKKFFFEIDLQSFKTYFKTKMWISIFFSFGVDGGRHS